MEKNLDHITFTHYPKVNTSKLALDDLGLSINLTSFGAFHKGNLYPPGGQPRENNDVLKHELGHATASEVMGHSLYAPSIWLSYALQGHSSSFFEFWADLEKKIPTQTL